MKQKKQKSFSRQNYLLAVVSTFILISITFFCTHISSGIIPMMELKERIDYCIKFYILIFILLFAVVPFINKIIAKDIETLFSRENKKFNIKEHTELVKKIIKFPRKFFGLTQAFFLFGTFTCIIYLTLKYDFIKKSQIAYFILMAIECSYFTGIFNFMASSSICNRYAKQLIKKGIDKETVLKEHQWGMKLNQLTRSYILYPVVIFHLLQVLYLWNAIENNFSKQNTILNIGILITISGLLVAFLTIVLQNQISKYLKQINSLLFQIKSENLEKGIYIPVDLSNELSYNIFILNDIMSYIQHITTETSVSGINILNATQELFTNASNTSGTAEDKVKSVKNYIGIMEETLSQLEGLIEKISAVKESSQTTKSNIYEGSEILKKDILQIEEIVKSNQKTIEKINEFSNLVEETQELIANIESIAEKTRTIAYNAEIEATSAGENGEKFHIVALEIRRLAGAITDSINEAKSKLKAIQYSSDTLLITSEAGTQHILESQNFFKELKEHVNTLCVSSEITAESTAKINDIIDIQRNTFIQIQIALKQIRSGFDYFISSSAKITETANIVMLIAEQLNMSKGGFSLGDVQ